MEFLKQYGRSPRAAGTSRIDGCGSWVPGSSIRPNGMMPGMGSWADRYTVASGGGPGCSVERVASRAGCVAATVAEPALAGRVGLFAQGG